MHYELTDTDVDIQSELEEKTQIKLEDDVGDEIEKKNSSSQVNRKSPGQGAIIVLDDSSTDDEKERKSDAARHTTTKPKKMSHPPKAKIAQEKQIINLEGEEKEAGKSPEKKRKLSISSVPKGQRLITCYCKK